MNDDKEPHSDSSESKEEKKEDKIAGDKNQKTSTLLPLARVKRIIKSDPDVKLISSDACFLVAKATELFMDYLVQETYKRTKRENRKVIQYKDLSKTIKETDELEFLGDILPEPTNTKKE
jgi:histone H3/H4